MSAYLKGLQGEFQGRKIPIGQNVFIIGRGSASQLVLRDTYISRTHASIFPTKTGYAIRDENSRAGIKVNGQNIHSVLLHHGDTIELGSHAFRFLQGHQAQSPQAVQPQQQQQQQVSHHAPQAQYAPSYQPQPNQPAYTQNIGAPNRDRTTAALLAIFLGGVGAHKLYLGEKDKFILYLIFSWSGIPAILGIVEGVTLLGMGDAQFHAKYP